MVNRIIKRSLTVLLILLLVAQFIRIDRSVPDFDPEGDFIRTESVPDHIASILTSACYDCHSYQTRYPWYSQVAPFSWWLKGHINHAREHMNFSIWSSYDQETQKHNLMEAEEEVRGGFMPLPSYTWIHGDARLSDDERKTLADWFYSMSASR